MDRYELQDRTKGFAKRVIRLSRELIRQDEVGRVIARQLIRSGTSVGANYRAACRARSRVDFVAKLGIVEEEADESAYWIELIIEEKLLAPERVQELYEEALELVRIISASRRTARGR